MFKLWNDCQRAMLVSVTVRVDNLSQQIRAKLEENLKRSSLLDYAG